ncbi:hypothetical protein K503DRAFT_492496 [Rhizopogon vinicolor AM-OR11-026]|uniref:Uncharacterized protein n=1 Tax=Rhizopogon vinicolor AM-OR11-026 TaxID=1314800 RepID=A0A1B7MMF6_9AGAM|nr:hypothetical protein K503DRAFT_492496 [Rhizopogon vinicolor AM-OR11-026]
MNEGDHPRQKKRWRLLTDSPLLQDSGMRAVGDSEPSPVPLSRTGSSSGIVRRLWDNVTKDDRSRSPIQYSNSAPTSNSSAHDPISGRASQVGAI